MCHNPFYLCRNYSIMTLIFSLRICHSPILFDFFLSLRYYYVYFLGVFMDKNEFQDLLSKTGLNKRELAELVGIPYSTVNGWGSKVPYPPYTRFLLEAVLKIQTLDRIVISLEPFLRRWNLAVFLFCLCRMASADFRPLCGYGNRR